MSTINLHRLFNPKSVAVIGASEKKGSIGFLILKNLIKNDFTRDIYPVNPKYSIIMDLPSFANIEDIGSALLKQCLKAVQGKGLKQVMGIVLAENIQMLMLGKKLGFSVKRNSDSGEYDLLIDVKDMADSSVR